MILQTRKRFYERVTSKGGIISSSKEFFPCFFTHLTISLTLRFPTLWNSTSLFIPTLSDRRITVSVRRSPMNFATSWVVWWASVSNFPSGGALSQKRTHRKDSICFTIKSPPFYENFNNIHSVLVFKSEDKDVIPITIKNPNKLQ